MASSAIRVLDLRFFQHGAWRVPTQMILGLASLLIFGIVLWARPRLREGESWTLYLALFRVCRAFVIEFWRARSVIIGALSLAQIVCFGVGDNEYWNLVENGAKTQVVFPGKKWS